MLDRGLQRRALGSEVGVGQWIVAANAVDQGSPGAVVERAARLDGIGIERRDRAIQYRCIVVHGITLCQACRARPLTKPRQRIGGAYWMPPTLQSWLMPRGTPNCEPTPTLR